MMARGRDWCMKALWLRGLLVLLRSGLGEKGGHVVGAVDGRSDLRRRRSRVGLGTFIAGIFLLQKSQKRTFRLLV